MSGKQLQRNVKRSNSSLSRSHTLHSTITLDQLHMLIGTPVCAVLQDGSIYCGTISGVDNGELLLQGFRGDSKLSSDTGLAKAQIAALGGLGSMFDGGGASAATAGPAGGLGGMLGGMLGGGGGGGALGGLGGMGNWFRIGLGVVQFLFPLMKGFGV